MTLRWNVLVEYLLDVGRSLCRHGFDRILIVNGHGSNSRSSTWRRGCSTSSTAGRLRVELLPDERGVGGLLAELRTRGRGGMAHACELETTLYLAIRPELVQMERGGTEIPAVRHAARVDGLVGRAAVVMPHWSALTSRA